MRFHFVGALAMLALPLLGAERTFDFTDLHENQPPPGFRSTVTGQGKAGDWKIVLDDVPPMMPSFTGKSTVLTRRPVLGQLAKDATDDHYPLLVFEGEAFGDFTLTTRFKLVDGAAEQMAGVAFRIQDEKNYYYVRASGLGNSFYFFKFVKGELIGPIGSKLEIAKGVWHSMTVECRGSQITCSLDGKAIIPEMRQDTFPRGKIGFWTKSDSVSYFADTRIIYTPVEVPARVLVRETVKKYPRLLDLRIYIPGEDAKTPRLIACKEEAEISQSGGPTERDVLSKGNIYYGKDKEKGSVSVTMPLRDRNGEIMAAARVVMKSFAGQTEQNALARATPIVKEMQGRIQTLQDLLE
jgi:hypothetical protein